MDAPPHRRALTAALRAAEEDGDARAERRDAQLAELSPRTPVSDASTFVLPSAPLASSYDYFVASRATVLSHDANATTGAIVFAPTLPAPLRPGSPAHKMQTALAASAERRASKLAELPPDRRASKLAEPPAPASPDPTLDRSWRAFVRDSVSNDQIDVLARIGATSAWGEPLRAVELPVELRSKFSLRTRLMLIRYGIIR